MLEYYRVKSNSVFHYFRKVTLESKMERFEESSESNDHKNNKVKFSPFKTISQISRLKISPNSTKPSGST